MLGRNDSGVRAGEAATGVQQVSDVRVEEVRATLELAEPAGAVQQRPISSR